MAKGLILASHNYANDRITVRSEDKAVGVVPEDLDTVPFLVTKDKSTAAFIRIQSELHVNHCNQSTDLLAKICDPAGQIDVIRVRQESSHHNLFNVWHRLSSVSG